MHNDFYTTMAQVLPLLLLALIWDSAYLERLRGQRRRKRREDPSGVRFWTKPRVRAYTLFVAAVVVVGTASALLVLGGMIPDTPGLRIALASALMIVLGTVLTRICYDVISATHPRPDDTTANYLGERKTWHSREPSESLIWF